jgi:hypothetical protein
MANNLSLLLIAGGAAVLGFAFLSGADGLGADGLPPTAEEGSKRIGAGDVVESIEDGKTVIAEGFYLKDAIFQNCATDNLGLPIVQYNASGKPVCQPVNPATGRVYGHYVPLPTPVGPLGDVIEQRKDLSVVVDPIVSVIALAGASPFRIR